MARTRGGATFQRKRGLRSSATKPLSSLKKKTRAKKEKSVVEEDVSEEVHEHQVPVTGSPSSRHKRTREDEPELGAEAASLVHVKKPRTRTKKSIVEAGGDVPTLRPFKTKCRPLHLVDMMSKFSPSQITSVNEISFGGLLSLKLKRNPTSMYRWLIDSFDYGGCMFSIDNSKEFVVTEYDVYDVFCLPLNPKSVKEITRSANKKNPDFVFKHKWRLNFGLTDENDQIPLNLLEAGIPTLGQGGDEFKQLFVMHAISTFLAPTSNRTADLRIVKPLDDVGQIKNLNWCKYVLEKLCEGVKSYKNGEIQNCCGCILMLEIIYFHRLKFRNVELSTSLPLIQHWNDELIRDKIKKEKLSKSFGCGILLSDVYPEVSGWSCGYYRGKYGEC